MLVLNEKDCEGLAWCPPLDCMFAADRPLVPLHVGELAQAVTTMPIAVVMQEGVWRLVGVCGVQPDHNVFIRKGKWLGQYLPEWLQTWPFESVKVGEKVLLAFDRDSGLLSQQAGYNEQTVEAFFDQGGQLGSATAKRVDALKRNFPKQQKTQNALRALSRYNLLMPWPEALRDQLGVTIEGLQMVDERALSKLGNDEFLSLRETGALPVAYSINLSVPQSHLLTRLSRLNPASYETVDLDTLFGEEDDNLSFNC